MKNLFCLILFYLFCSQSFTSCKKVPPPIAMQSIPVASIPIGAEVYSNGRLIGQTPIMVTLEKTHNHIITIAKSGFLPQNVTIMKRCDDTKLYTRALIRGVDDGLFFRNPGWAVSTVQDSIEEDETTGHCYILEPQVVSVHLIPENQVQSGKEDIAPKSLTKDQAPL